MKSSATDPRAAISNGLRDRRTRSNCSSVTAWDPPAFARAMNATRR